MLKKIALNTVVILVLFTALLGCRSAEKTEDTFEILVDEKITSIRLVKDINPALSQHENEPLSLNNYVFGNIELSVDSTYYHWFYGTKLFFNSVPIKINGLTKEEQEQKLKEDKNLAKREIESFFISKKDTLYYLRCFFKNQLENLDFVNRIRLVKPIAVYTEEDSLHRYYEPLKHSRLRIEKATSILKKTNTSFNTGTVTSSWGVSKTHLKLGDINFLGTYRYGTSVMMSPKDDIRRSLKDFVPDSLEVDNHTGNTYRYFQHYKRVTKNGYSSFFDEIKVFNNGSN